MNRQGFPWIVPFLNVPRIADPVKVAGATPDRSRGGSDCWDCCHLQVQQFGIFQNLQYHVSNVCIYIYRIYCTYDYVYYIYIYIMMYTHVYFCKCETI